MGALAASLLLAACGEVTPHPGLLGRMIDSRPPPVSVAEDGYSGALIGGPAVPDVPDAAVDKVVADGLRQWLTFEEKQSLAVASQRAAVAPASTAVDWRSHDGGNEVTATGSATAIGDVYRSLRGEICRDVRQYFTKQGEPHAQTVALCRETVVGGVEIWVASAG